MNKERLLRLADLLRKEADAEGKLAKFDLVEWGTVNCNTTACAIGLACLSSKFPGLKLDKGALRDEKEIIPSYTLAPGCTAIGWDAVSRYFYLDENDAKYLFNSSSYAPSRQSGPRAARAVATRIERYVRKHSRT